jgi:hypothetical protein
MIENPTIRELFQYLQTTPIPALAKNTDHVPLYESLLAGQASRAAQGDLLTEPIVTLDEATASEIAKIRSKNELSSEEKEFLEYIDLLNHIEHFLINIKFIGELLKKVPELQSAFDEHIRDNDDPLPYLFIGDVQRFVVAEAEASRLEPTQPAARILNFFEENLRSGGQYTAGFIHASFTDNFPDNDPVLLKLSQLIGPLLKQQLKAEDKI